MVPRGTGKVTREMKSVLVTTDKRIDQLKGALEWADVIGFDTESAGPLLRDRKRPFINMAKSEMIGFSVAFQDTKSYYVPICHKGKNVPYDEVAEILRLVAEVPRVWVHNLKHEAKVLPLAGHPIPPGAMDSYVASWLALSRPMGLGLKQLTEEVLGRKCPDFPGNLSNMSGAEALEYTTWDALNTLELGERFLPKVESMKLRQHMRDVETPFAALLARMELHGMTIVPQVLRDASAKCRAEIANVLREWHEMFPDLSISSDTQLQELFTEGTWVSCGTTKGGAHSCKAEIVEKQLQLCDKGSAGYAAAELRLRYQTVAKIASTYTMNVVDESMQWPDGRIHPDFNQIGPRTGRLSSSNPNAQNFPAPENLPWGPVIRAAFVPSRKGLKLTGCDYSQIELRVLAHYAGGRLREAYEEGADIHQETADAIGQPRSMGKTINFGYLAYGGKVWGLAQKLKCTETKAKRVKKDLEEAYSHIGDFRARVVDKASKRRPIPFVRTITGRRRYIPELKSASKRERESGQRIALNTIIQGSAADLMKMAMLAIDARAIAEGVKDYAMIATIHDEVICESSEPKKLEKIIREEMEAQGEAVGLRCPILAEPKSGDTWAQIK